MGDASAAPAADHAWLAKVLAGDPVACGVLDLARSLPADEWDVFVRSVDRIKAGMPTAEALAMLQQERSGKPA